MNPLIAPLLDILGSSQDALSEYELICRLEARDIPLPEAESSDLALFRRHFMVMNALYQLQRDVLIDGYFL